MTEEFKKGDIIFVENNNITESGIQGNSRPWLVISNNKFNQFSPVLTCVALTTKCKASPVHLFLHKTLGLPRNSYVLCEQIQTISKNNITKIICSLPDSVMAEINTLLSFQLAL